MNKNFSEIRSQQFLSYILNTSFVYSFFILHINLTEYKHNLCEKNVIFANFAKFVVGLWHIFSKLITQS